MRLLAYLAGALALVLSPCAALAQAPVGKQIIAPAGYLPAEAIYCDDGTGHAALCNFGSGPGNSGSSYATSRISFIATASATGYATNDQLDRIVITTPSTGAVVFAYWINITQGTMLASAPASGNIAIKPETITNTAFGSNCIVVSGNQAYTVGAQQQCNLTATGRIKVGISSAGNIDPAAQLATTLDADLIACKYRVTPATWTDLWTGALRCNSLGALVVDGSGVKQPTTIADGDSATLGAKADAKSTATDTTPASEIALLKGQIDRLQAIVAAFPAKDTNSDLRVPTPTIYETVVSLTANTSQTLVAARTARIGITITCDGTATVGISQLGATLTSVASAATVMPATANASFTPLFASKTAYTYYTGTAQNCRVTEYAQQ